MRLLLLVITIVVLAFVFFGALNSEERVSINLGMTTYDDVPLYRTVFLAFAVGALFVGIIGLVEGTTLRLANRRLRRDLHKLETEAHFLRTQGSGAELETTGITQRKPDDLPRRLPASTDAPKPSSAPIYETGDDDPYRGLS